MNTSRTLTGWRLSTAAAVESLWTLCALILRLAGAALLLVATADWRLMPAAAGAALLECVLLPPLRLGRELWYLALFTDPTHTPSVALLWSGFRRWGAALRWRYGLWWRCAAVLLTAGLPAALLWGMGHRLSVMGDPDRSLLWLVLGGIAWLGAVACAALLRCRYILVPFLLWQGQPAGQALALSRQLTRRHVGAVVNFWGGQAGRLCLCLLPGAALWVLPAIRQDRIAFCSRLAAGHVAPVARGRCDWAATRPVPQK